MGGLNTTAQRAAIARGVTQGILAITDTAQLCNGTALESSVEMTKRWERRRTSRGGVQGERW